jgi:signal transduction histidine kinase
MLRSLPIRSKLVAILLVPLLALGVITWERVSDQLDAGYRAERAARSMTVAVVLTALAHELQRELGHTARYLGSGKRVGRADLDAQRAATDDAIAASEDDLANAGRERQSAALRQRLAAVQERLANLGLQRRAIDQVPVPLDRAVGGYAQTVSVLLDMSSQIVEAGGNERLLRGVASFAAVSQAKELNSQERALLEGAFAQKSYTHDEYLRLVSVLAAEEVWLGLFRTFATAQQLELLNHTMVGPSVDEVDRMRLLALQGDASPWIGSWPKAWFDEMSAKIDLLRQVEVQLGGEVVGVARASAADARQRALQSSLVLLVIAIVAIAISLAVASSLVRPLRRLKRLANEVAARRLPGLVDQLQRGVPVRLDEEARPIVLRSKDEIGEVAEAFNAVHRVAVHVATRQAKLRKTVADVFLNMARRSQSLIDRQLELIDDLERNESDPEALDELFRLDHLATRMRRNAEDLIVLSGAAEPARRWSRPVTLADAVRAAIAEVEDYTRVELIPVDDVAIVGNAANDVVHLLAELIENATSFSPPDTKVLVTGQRVGGAHLIEVEDRGIGMPAHEMVMANERLGSPAEDDFSGSQRLGFFVVARLAARHRIRVQLHPSWYGGVCALVVLPGNLTIQPSNEPQPSLAPRAKASGTPLPIFEATRTDWFERGLVGQYPPVARQAPAARDQAVPDRARAVRAGNGSLAATGGQPPAPAEPVGGERVSTFAGELPQRVPKANLAPGIAAGRRPAPQPSAGEALTPSEVSALLSRYRSGLERGRDVVSAEQPSGVPPRTPR